MAAGVLGFAALAGQGGQAAAAGEPQMQAFDKAIVGMAEDRERAGVHGVSRSLPARTFLAPAESAVSAQGKAAQVPAKEAKPARPTEPAPVAGLNQIQMNNANKIVKAAEEMGLGKRAQVIAVATAMQESNLYNLASTRLPESYNYANEGEGSDHDSVGLFQQRTTTGWGPVKDLMDPNYSTKAFLKSLIRIPGWDHLPLTVAAQRVQVSAYPDHYAKHETRATEIVDAINK